MIGPGSRLAHYEVVSALGKGGMGEVWRAMDTKLGREVAIKTLPPEFAEDPDRLARFEREARLLASLNHPNIAAIYGLEEHEGSRFLALELVEGDTLGDRLQGGAIPVDESLKLAQQIAEAVEAAHEKGVIHRDLKPANIKVTEDGQIKILDFGLAKAFASEETEVNVSNSPTLSMAATQQGLILGTAAYMSPEQAKGRPVDERTDVWAFGCVLYEMLTGRSVFEGEDAADILGAVLAKDVNWDPLPSNLHPRVRELLERCLARQQKNRYRGISDARVDIERILADPGGAVVPPAAEKVHRTSRPKLLWGGAVVLAVVAGVVGWSLKPDSPRPGRVVRFAQLLPEGQQLTDTSRNVVAVSPDGSRMVYAADLQLYVRDMDALEAAPISGTADPFPANPFISPDGTWVGFWSGGDQQLKRIPMDGAAPVTIAEMPNNSYGAPSWGDDDTIVWARAEGIMRFSAGAPPDLMIPNEVEGELLTWPQILPDGDSVLFAVVSDRDATEGETVVQSLESGDRKILFGGTHPRYVSTGHVVYVAGNILFAVPFDVDRLEVTGDPVVLAADIQTGPVQYDVSDSGALVYVPAVSRGNVLLWMDRNGNPEPIDTIPRGDYDDGVRLSPDGGRVLVTRNGDRWIYDIASGRESRITRDGMGVGGYAEWDPTGTRIAHTSRRGGDLGSVWIESIDGGGEPRQITDLGGGRVDLDSWSRDGRMLAVHQHDPNENILMIPLDEADPRPEPFLMRDFGDGGSVFSPDGRYVAYASEESGQAEIQIRPYPGPGGQVTVSVGGGSMPVWAPTGELFYRNQNGLMSVSVVTDPELIIGPPRQIFEASPLNLVGFTVSPRPNYDVTDDGERFLMVVNDTSSDRPKINVVLDWFQELGERAPVP